MVFLTICNFLGFFWGRVKEGVELLRIFLVCCSFQLACLVELSFLVCLFVCFVPPDDSCQGWYTTHFPSSPPLSTRPTPKKIISLFAPLLHDPGPVLLVLLFGDPHL